jgi:signal peptidase I
VIDGGGEAPPGEHARSVLRSLAEIPVIAVLALIIVFAVRSVLVQPFYIPSPSMVPQLMIQDKILVSRLSYRLHGVHRGDLVVFHAPAGVEVGGRGSGPMSWLTRPLGLAPRDDVLVKRVIGLPGDTVEGRDYHVYVNGLLLLEPYLPAGTLTVPSFGPRRVPPKMVWVMGDNRGNSLDSRYFGPIREHSVIGRAVLRVWPLDNLSFL